MNATTTAQALSERPSFGEAVENYAKEIYALRRRDSDKPVTTNELAARLSVTPASASGMIKKLDKLGLATHEPYRGVELTPAGERIALEVIRHHRLLELYLVEQLQVPWDRVHAEAEVLEHVISEDLEARIAEKLGNPTHDPHGDPIPTAELVIAEDAQPDVSLQQLEPGAQGQLVRVSDADPEMLRYLAERGVAIGDHFEVVERQPFGGPLTVSFNGNEIALGPGLAEAMSVNLRS